MHDQQKEPKTKTNEKTNLTALAFDRDKNLFYLASDESIDEVLDQDGYHVVHANRNLAGVENKKKT